MYTCQSVAPHHRHDDLVCLHTGDGRKCVNVRRVGRTCLPVYFIGVCVRCRERQMPEDNLEAGASRSRLQALSSHLIVPCLRFSLSLTWCVRLAMTPSWTLSLLQLHGYP